ncbi:substrate-binding periplasmic protein [Oleidesulfovibrio sp.]|uniref:substrate-binding periplasmic protein n=1 Tax=Oleidesulfovibrio sp. TaxID=2909707 RepID=UPI003A840365
MLSAALLCTAFIFDILYGYGFAYAHRAAPESAVKVTVLSYYTSPPFLTAEGRGLTHDFVALLNKAAGGRFHFELSCLPKRRAEMALERADTALLLFVNPAWIDVAGRYSWSDGFLPDRNGLLSSAKQRVSYDGVEDLRGLTMGGVYSSRYGELDTAVALKELRREDAATVRQNLLKLVMGRIDFTVAPESVLRSLVCELGLEGQVYFSPLPFSEYTRHIMIKGDSKELQGFVTHFVRDLLHNSEWQKIAEQYYLIRDGAMNLASNSEWASQGCLLMEKQ